MTDSESAAHISKEIQQRLEKEINFGRTFGLIRPIITTKDEKWGRFVAVGNRELYRSKLWKTFPDFLFDYVWDVMGKDWMERQKLASESQLHTLIRWYKAFRKFSRQQLPASDGIIHTRPNGSTAALQSFAYDLFTVENNLHLPTSFLKRLRNYQQFQGARYELFCICTLIRGGFLIELEDESDPSKSHPELHAVHFKTGTRIAVEAKSKHRPGVLGMPGQNIPDNKMRLGKIRQLLKDAVTKDIHSPLIIFFDVNLPPQHAEKILGFRESTKVADIIDTLPQINSKTDLFNFVLFTNHPHHYGREDSTDPERIYSGIISLKPKYLIANREVIDDVVSGALKYGRVPQDFDSIP